MARPSKSVETMSKNLTKEEKEKRLKIENALKGKADKITPPKHLNKKQKSIFKVIVGELRESNILGNLDVYILTTCAISIDRLNGIETLFNENIENLYNKELLAFKREYTKDFFRCCNELSLSPQARAKLGNINLNANKEKQDPLLKVLAGGKK